MAMLNYPLSREAFQEWSETISPSWNFDHSNTCNNDGMHPYCWKLADVTVRPLSDVLWMSWQVGEIDSQGQGESKCHSHQQEG